jgi:ACS family pantothenate transporter-like MFS transporter
MNYLDRSNITAAYVSGMKTDLKFQGNQFNVINTAFSVGYIVYVPPPFYWTAPELNARSGNVPNNLALQYVKPRYFFPVMMAIWAGLTMCTAAAKKPQNIMVIRFFQGIAESTTFVGTHYILGSWYTASELGKRSGIFTASGLAGTMFGGFLQTAIHKNLDGINGLAGWRWLFIVKLFQKKNSYSKILTGDADRRAHHPPSRYLRLLPLPRYPPLNPSTISKLLGTHPSPLSYPSFYLKSPA